MKNLLFLIFTALMVGNVYATEIASFNTDTLGKNINTPFEIFPIEKNQKKTLLYPTNIQLDIKNNICTAVALFYPDNKIKFDELRKIINVTYPGTEYMTGNEFLAWRVEKERFTITMFIEKDCIEDYNHIRINYVMWDNNNIEYRIEKLKKILKHLNQNTE